MKTDSNEQKLAAASVLIESLSTFYRLLHPIMPFITEELWGHLQNTTEKLGFGQEHIGSSVCALAEFPSAAGRRDEALEEDFSRMQDIVRTLRNMRANANISPKDSLDCALLIRDEKLRSFLEQEKFLVLQMANVKQLDFVEEPKEGFAVTVLQDMQVFANLVEHMDIDAEISRKQKAAEKVEKEITALAKKLENKGFVEKAPAEVVEAEKKRLSETQAQKEQILSAIEELRALR